MKLYCLDFDNCGFYKKYEEDEVVPKNICPDCYSLAAVYSDNYTPIFIDSDPNKQEYLESLLQYYLTKET